MVALWWIKQLHKRWRVWVQNRVNIIRENTSPNNWFHVPSASNPSDVSTRSSSLCKLDLSLWFSGPQFLFDIPENWPSKEIVLSSEGNQLEEREVEAVVLTSCSVDYGIGTVIDCHRYGSLDTLLRVTCYF